MIEHVAIILWGVLRLNVFASLAYLNLQTFAIAITAYMNKDLHLKVRDKFVCRTIITLSMGMKIISVNLHTYHIL